MFKQLFLPVMLVIWGNAIFAADVTFEYKLEESDIQFLLLPIHTPGIEVKLITPVGAENYLFSEMEEEGYRIAIAATKSGSYKLKVSDVKASSKPENFTRVKKPENYTIQQAKPEKGVHPLLDEYMQNESPDAQKLFWKKISVVGGPLIHKKTADIDYMTFIWKGELNTFSVELLGSKRSFVNEENLLTNIPNSNIWFKTFEMQSETVFAYTYSHNTAHLQDEKFGELYYQALRATAVTDPLNNNLWETQNGKFRSESQAFASNAKQHYWSVKKPNVPSGSVTNHTFKSTLLGNSRIISVYTPPDKSSIGADTPIVFISDGERYSTDTLTPNAIDNLIYEKKIPSVVAIFIHNTVPSRRSRELPCTKGFTGLMADELLPWIKQEFPQLANSKDIVVTGSSFGGLAAACANIMRPEIFTNVLSQSGAFWWYPDKDSDLSDNETHGWVVRKYRELGCNGNTRFYFDAGQLEDNGKGLRSIGENSETLFTMLTKKGCSVGHQRYPGGHDLYHWKETIAHGLISLLGHKVKSP